MSKGILRTALDHKLPLELVFREAPIDWEELNLVDWERKGFTDAEAAPLPSLQGPTVRNGQCCLHEFATKIGMSETITNATGADVSSMKVDERCSARDPRTAESPESPVLAFSPSR
jgi:hypothetical protein